MQMLDENCSNNTKTASGEKKRKRRRRLLYSSRCELERSRMRSSKHMSRLSAVQELMGVRIDFSGEEVTNLASIQEVVATVDATQAINKDNVNVLKGTTAQPFVRIYYIDARF